MNPKVLFVILVLLIILFVAGIGVGSTQADRPTAQTPPWVERLSDLLVSKQALRAEDIDAAIPPECGQQLEAGEFVIPAGQTCWLTVKPSRANVRTLTLTLEQGTAAAIRLEPNGENQLTNKKTLSSPGAEMKLSIMKEGGTLQVGCVGLAGSPCRLRAE